MTINITIIIPEYILYIHRVVFSSSIESFRQAIGYIEHLNILCILRLHVYRFIGTFRPVQNESIPFFML